MNVSQLAVYQLPNEALKMQKRTTVPFYNRRRALKQRTTSEDDTGTLSRSSPEAPAHDKQACHLPVTSGPSLLPSNTYHSLPCLDTATTLSISNSTSNASAVTVTNHTGYDVNLVAPASTQSANDDLASRIRPRAAGWSRVGYYTSSSPAQATGLSFLANRGDPQKSGTFDYAFGNSLSYVTPDGSRVAGESTPFNGRLATSEQEIAVFSNKECDRDCPYWRPDATSHFAWSGSSKAFFIEFQMDHYSNRGNDQGLISDAPAYWFLNAAIPRILQYGNDRNNIPCSCWSTGCGEFDAFELLGAGEVRAKSTLHRQGNLEGGDSNYFRRPVGRTMKFAVIWHFPHITARVLDNAFQFDETLSEDAMKRLVAYDPDSWIHSLFPVGD